MGGKVLEMILWVNDYARTQKVMIISFQFYVFLILNFKNCPKLPKKSIAIYFPNAHVYTHLCIRSNHPMRTKYISFGLLKGKGRHFRISTKFLTRSAHFRRKICQSIETVLYQRIWLRDEIVIQIRLF